MITLTIDLINPKAKALIQSLVDLRLIAIRPKKKNSLAPLLKKMRIQGKHIPTLAEITK